MMKLWESLQLGLLFGCLDEPLYIYFLISKATLRMNGTCGSFHWLLADPKGTIKIGPGAVIGGSYVAELCIPRPYVDPSKIKDPNKW